MPKKPIVLVEDETSYNDLMRQLLADNLDCEVHGFTKPLEALTAIPALDPGVIVTDYFMPEIDGIEFIRRATPIAPRARFVMITGHNLSAQKEQLDGLTALKGFLNKPFGWRKLADEILRAWPSDIPPPSHRADATSI